jgi:hypothetical protein
MDTATSDIRAVEFTPSRDGDSPVLPDLLDQIPDDEDIGTVTADGAYDTRRCHGAIIARGGTAFGHSLEPVAFVPHSRSAGTADRGRRIAQPPGRATKPCAPRAITAGRSGNYGPDTMPVAALRQRCAVSRPSASASPQGTPTARPPKSTSASFAGSLEHMAFACSFMNRFNALGTAEIVRVA